MCSSVRATIDEKVVITAVSLHKDSQTSCCMHARIAVEHSIATESVSCMKCWTEVLDGKLGSAFLACAEIRKWA